MKNIRSLSILVAVFALMAVLWGGFVWMYLELQEERMQLTSAQEAFESFRVRDTFSTSLETLAQDTRVERERLEEFTTKQDVVELIRLFEEASTSAGVDISVDAVSAGSKKEVLQSITVVLRATGAFSDMFQFLSLIESVPGAVLIDQFELEKNIEGSGWSAVLRVHTLVEADSL